MILQKEILQHKDKYNVPPDTIDKDWVLGHVLNAMYAFEAFRQNMVFKGGTCLRKCYFNDYRFSEDLDFTLLNKEFVVDEKCILRFLLKAEELSGIKFETEPKIKKQIHKDIEQGYEVEVRFWGANHKSNQKPLPVTRWQTSIKFDISFSEKLVCSPEIKELSHPYSDNPYVKQAITCYSLQEIVAEKLRSLVQRNRPRDIYDNWFLSNHIENQYYPKIRKLLQVKAESKLLDISKIEYFVDDQRQKAIKRAWDNSLMHQIGKGQLPDFDSAYNAVKSFVINILNS
jgi:predicted nucleotidyltransferase component of viral defense system